MREISKGEWRHVKGTGGVDYIMADNVRIATMVTPSTTARITEREAFGNGEIMAASGALLSACKVALEATNCAEGESGEGWAYCDCWTCKAARGLDAAIAQAVERREWPKPEGE